MSAVVLGILPFLVGTMLFVLNRQLMLVLFVDPRGRFMLVLALASVVVGLLAMAAIIKRSLR